MERSEKPSVLARFRSSCGRWRRRPCDAGRGPRAASRALQPHGNCAAIAHNALPPSTTTRRILIGTSCENVLPWIHFPHRRRKYRPTARHKSCYGNPRTKHTRSNRHIYSKSADIYCRHFQAFPMVSCKCSRSAAAMGARPHQYSRAIQTRVYTRPIRARQQSRLHALFAKIWVLRTA